MKKEEKATAIAELHEKFSRAKLAVMTECSGLEVNHVTELRRQLRGVKAEFKVGRNTWPLAQSMGHSFWQPSLILRDH